jgi:3-phenylpropionate/trans-cinnamate dioxygenase ferredoxin component
MVATWIDVGPDDILEPDDALGFSHDERDYALYRTDDGEFFASDGRCTHQQTLLCDGMVMDGFIECPKHLGRFELRSGRAVRAPAIRDLTMYPVKVEGGRVYVNVGE